MDGLSLEGGAHNRAIVGGREGEDWLAVFFTDAPIADAWRREVHGKREGELLCFAALIIEGTLEVEVVVPFRQGGKLILCQLEDDGAALVGNGVGALVVDGIALGIANGHFKICRFTEWGNAYKEFIEHAIPVWRIGHPFGGTFDILNGCAGIEHVMVATQETEAVWYQVVHRKKTGHFVDAFRAVKRLIQGGALAPIAVKTAKRYMNGRDVLTRGC